MAAVRIPVLLKHRPILRLEYLGGGGAEGHRARVRKNEEAVGPMLSWVTLGLPRHSGDMLRLCLFGSDKLQPQDRRHGASLGLGAGPDVKGPPPRRRILAFGAFAPEGTVT
jgi:hypothetical protein